MAKDPYAGSNYDAAGMPLSTTYADYDNAEEVRLNMVKDKVVEPQNHVFDLEYVPRPIDEKFGPSKFVSDSELNDKKEAELKEEREAFAFDLEKLEDKGEDKEDNDGEV